MADAPTITRRNLFRYGAATGAAAGATAAMPAAHAHTHGPPRVSPAPKPIPGGIPIPDGPLIHTFLPGPEDVTLPFTGLTLQGQEVEPSVITDYRGFTALAYHVGSATGSDGRRYDLETDIRAMAATSPRTGRGSGRCSPACELTSSSPVRARRPTSSTTTTAASSHPACSGWSSSPATPSGSATTGAGRP
jgi:hypothetical protein